MKSAVTFLIFVFSFALPAFPEMTTVRLDTSVHKVYPQVNEVLPNVPSPFQTEKKSEYVIAVTKASKFAIFPVTLSNDGWMCPQLVVDTADFPSLSSGLHTDEELALTKMITGRSIAEITDLGRPGQYSEDGFMTANENVLSLLQADNIIVRRLGLTHPQMAKPLFHLLNMMDTDIKLRRWNSADHEWQHITYFYYNGNKVFVEAHDTKGGQLSIFDDGIQGAFWMVIKRDLTEQETGLLKKHYPFLSSEQFEALTKKLSQIYTGEMEPQYIVRYGFYEGHSGWRTDPISIAFIFGLKTLDEIEAAFPGKLYEILTAEFTREYMSSGAL